MTLGAKSKICDCSAAREFKYYRPEYAARHIQGDSQARKQSILRDDASTGWRQRDLFFSRNFCIERIAINNQFDPFARILTQPAGNDATDLAFLAETTIHIDLLVIG